MTAPERGTATPAPELARRVGHVARTLVAAGRDWSRHPSEPPAVHTSADRQFRYAVEETGDPDALAAHSLAHL